jgi:hypothetical protein
MPVVQGILSTPLRQLLRTHRQRLRNMGRDPNPARPEAIGQWKLAFGAPPPPYLSVLFMQKALAYEAQCKRARGLPQRAASRLNIAAKITETSAVSTMTGKRAYPVLNIDACSELQYQNGLKRFFQCFIRHFQ